MKSDTINVKSDNGIDDILHQADKFSRHCSLKSKDSLKLRLLAEEAFLMLRGITEDMEAKIWFEVKNDCCFIKISAVTKMSRSKHDELLSVSSSGINTLARGITGKIREVIQLAFMAPGDLEKCAILNYGLVPIDAELAQANPSLAYHMIENNFWSLKRYKEGVFNEKDNADNEIAMDELEKSIVANLADDVSVGIDNGRVEVTISRKLENR